MSAVKRAWDQGWFRKEVYTYILPPCDDDYLYSNCTWLEPKAHYRMLKVHGTLECLHACRRFRSEMEKILFGKTTIRLICDDYNTLYWLDMSAVVQKIQKLDIQLPAVDSELGIFWMRSGLEKLCRGLISLRELNISFVRGDAFQQYLRKLAREGELDGGGMDGVDGADGTQVGSGRSDSRRFAVQDPYPPAQWWDESGPKTTIDGCPSDLALALQPFECFRSLKWAYIHLPKYRPALSSFDRYVRSVMAGNDPREMAEVEVDAAAIRALDEPFVEIEQYAKVIEWEITRLKCLEKDEWKWYKERTRGIMYGVTRSTLGLFSDCESEDSSEEIGTA